MATDFLMLPLSNCRKSGERVSAGPCGPAARDAMRGFEGDAPATRHQFNGLAVEGLTAYLVRNRSSSRPEAPMQQAI